MESFLSIGLGISLKAFDDCLDLNLKVPEIATEFMKAFMIFTFTLLSVNDFMFSVTVFLAFLGSSIVGGVDNPFWLVFTFITFCMSVISIRIPSYLLNSIIFFFFFILGIILEAILIPEEKSKRKTISRIGFCGVMGLLLHIPFFNVPYITKLCNFVIGYSITSVFISSYHPYIETILTGSPSSLVSQEFEPVDIEDIEEEQHEQKEQQSKEEGLLKNQKETDQETSEEQIEETSIQDTPELSFTETISLEFSPQSVL